METQKKNGTEIVFDFQDEVLSYKIKDKGGSHSMKVAYLEIDIIEINEYNERVDWFKYTGWIWIAYSALIILTTGKSSVFLLLGVVMLVIYYIRTTKYTSLKSDSGIILIIKDKKHDAILEKICSAKRRVLRDSYFFFNPENPVEKELYKYEFLRDNGAITQEEYTEACNRLLEENGVISKSKKKIK